MKHIERALEIAREERARLRDRLRVIDTASLEASDGKRRPNESHMQAAIRKARDANQEATAEVPQKASPAKPVQRPAASDAPVLTARLDPARNNGGAAKSAPAGSSAAPQLTEQAPQPVPEPIPEAVPRRPVVARARPAIDLTSIVYSETRVLNRPSQALSRARIVAGDGDDAVTRAYKLLRTQVLHRMTQKGWQTLAIVSPSASEGKTLTAINLGLALAHSVQHTVMLVDCDWRRPSVHRYFEYEPEHDIASYLSGKVPMSAALVNPGVPRFCFLPCRAPIKQSSERLGSALVGSFVNELRSRYANRIVVFDLPPMLLTDDSLSFLPHVDCALVVVEEDSTSREDVEQTLELIGRDKLLGTVLNKSRSSLREY